MFFKVSDYQLLGQTHQLLGGPSADGRPISRSVIWSDPSADGADRQNGRDISIHFAGLAACKSTSKGKDPRAQQLQLLKLKFMIVA